MQIETVEKILQKLHGIELRPTSVEVAPGGRFVNASPNLLPRPRGFRLGLTTLVPAGLAALALTLLIAALILPVERAHRRLDALEAAIASEKRAADEAIRLRQEIQTRTQEAGFLDSRKYTAASPTKLLAILTHLLPDDTFYPNCN